MALCEQLQVTSALTPIFGLFFSFTFFRCVFLFLFTVVGVLCNSAHRKPTTGTFIIFFLLLSALFHAARGNTSGHGSGHPIVYTRDQLLGLRGPARHPHQTTPFTDKLDIPVDIRRKSRGCRGGRKKRRYRPCLPSVIMGNVRSICNKTEELAALTRHQREYRECSVMCFTETWLNGQTPDSVVSLDGFNLVRGDRSVESGKKKGGGLAVFVNERWCNPGHVHVKEHHCSKDLELLVVGMRPYYIPREFGHVIVFCVYIPPSADAAAACERLHSAVTRIQTRHPRALLLISGDFNHASLSTTLPTFTQHVTCNTRDNKTLDHFYSNVKDAYTSAPLPPLGRSDHNIVYLRPQYTPRVRKEPAQKRSVKVWSPEASERLQDCFQTTDWDLLCSSHGEDIDGLTHCITDYISFCVDSIVPTRRVRCFSNNHPWVTPELKAHLNQKKRAFNSGDKEELKRVQHELQWRIRRSKRDYGKKLEEQLAQNNVRDVWRGLKNISGFGQSARGTADGDQRWADELNCYFNRFSSQPTSSGPLPVPPSSHVSDLQPHGLLPPPALPLLTPPRTIKPQAPSSPHTSFTPLPHPPQTVLSTATPPLFPSNNSPAQTPHPSPLSVTSAQVKRELQRLKRKAAGPDGISPRLLRTCADQLCEVLSYMYNLSLSLEKVPVLWKTSCVVPVPKTPHAKEPAHYRPVALTSHLMKTMERLILSHLRTVVSSTLDPLQFAYRPNIGVEDGVIYLLQRALTHLETAGSAVRVMFFDFSSAFNTIRPSLLRGKLEDAGVDGHLAAWTIDYLTDRPQYVRLRGCESETVVSSTGAPQGTVLSPFLFTLYTSDFTYNTDSCHLQKFSDDSAIVGCVTEGNDLEYRSVIRDFVDWCESNHLCLNTSKTKELVIDFRRRKTQPHSPVNIQGEDIETVDSFKYLGVHINNKLDWSHNTDALYRKGQSRLHLLRRLRSFGVCRPLLRTFYDSVVASAILYAVVCWAPGSTERDRKRLNKLIRRASSVLGCPLDPVEEVGERRVLSKFRSIMNNTSHPLNQTVEELSSSFSGRLRHPQVKKERYRRSFIPTAVRIYNTTIK